MLRFDVDCLRFSAQIDIDVNFGCVQLLMIFGEEFFSTNVAFVFLFLGVPFHVIAIAGTRLQFLIAHCALELIEINYENLFAICNHSKKLPRMFFPKYVNPYARLACYSFCTFSSKWCIERDVRY